MMQLSRSALLYVLAAFAGCVLLQSIFLPWWILPMAGFCLVWRLLVFSGRLSFPPGLVKFFLVTLVSIAMLLQFGFRVSLDVFVTLLLTGFSLKLLELYHQQDAQMLMYLAFFVLMTVFLFNQMPGYVLLVFVAATLVLAAMVAIQSAESELLLQWSQPLRKASLVTLCAIPVMLFMFVVMPRLPPLWSMPLQKQQQGKTGMGDSMSPGDIASLAKSSDLVFRATFPDGVPPHRELYWYGVLFDKFDGKRWTESCPDWRDRRCFRRDQWELAEYAMRKAVTGKKYQVIQEPHGKKWMYVLMQSAVRNGDAMRNRDGIYVYTRPMNQRQLYEAGYPLELPPADLGEADRDRYLALPVTGNPRSRELAAQWQAEDGNPGVIIQKALGLFRASFFYTLQPPILGEQRVDEFLFVTRKGFCEHFASSFVFLMRAAGIPSRVAMGYQGGEIHAADRYVVLRQYDAHAWAEVWLAGRGWVRVDPTAAVAAERIELGFSESFSDERFSVVAGFDAMRQIPLLNALRLQLEHIDYLWTRWVLGYEGDQQQALLKKLGLLSPLRVALWAGGSVALIFVLLCIFLYWREWWIAHEPPSTRRYRQLCHAYAQCGLERLPMETPLQYAERIAANDLSGADIFTQLSQQYYAWRYIGDNANLPEPAVGFASAARRLYWQLTWRAFKARFVFQRGEKS